MNPEANVSAPALEWLFGPSEGWSLEPVGRWLMGDGRGILDPVLFVTELMQRLDAAGAHVDRFRISSGTLHPQMVAFGVSWTRTEGAKLWSGKHGVQESDAYLGSPMQYVREQGLVFRKDLRGGVGDADHLALHDIHAQGMLDYVAVPLKFGSGSINVMMLATASPEGFTEQDVARFVALGELIIPTYELINTRRTTMGLLNTFVGRRVSERITQGQVKRGDGERIEAAFWYSDLRKFTSLSEALPTEDLLLLLNEYFEYCAAAAAPRGGEILQFIGDAILMVFEIPSPADEDRVCGAALDAAVDAFAAIAVVNQRRRSTMQPVIEFGLGLHLGTVVHANVGSPDRLSFNVVGPAVNMTARIQEMTKETGVPLLMSSDFARHVQPPLRSVGSFELRGIAKTTELFSLVET